MEEMFDLLRESLTGPPRLHLAYWAEYDGICHQQGAGSPAAEALLRRFDAQLGSFLQSIAGKNVAVILTADHGMLDTDREHVVDLDDHLELKADLTLPLCGEPRTAFCYVHAERREHFVKYVTERLNHCCELIPSSRLVAEGWFGIGPAHPELLHRVGDYGLLMKDRYVITERLPGERPFSQVGVHGGVTSVELHVPLVVIKD
jgi:hypothetical protein